MSSAPNAPKPPKEIPHIPPLAPPPQAVPARTTWRRPLMVRQLYSEAVPSTE